LSEYTEGVGIRTLEGTKPTDLESVPFGHSGTPSYDSGLISCLKICTSAGILRKKSKIS
jgi:hypothetical protein